MRDRRFLWEAPDDSISAPLTDDGDAQVVEALLDYQIATRGGDLFVEVGDRVTYCFADNLSVKLTVLTVDSLSNPRHTIVNEQTPLAQAILGLSQGDEDTFNAPGQKARRIRVLKIDRQGSVVGKMCATA